MPLSERLYLIPADFVIETAWEAEPSLFVRSTTGRMLVVTLSADCCSHSYFPKQSAEAMTSMAGERLLSLTDVEPVEVDSSHEVRYHHLRVVTDKSTTTIDWRNDSNGYYDGTIECVSIDGVSFIESIEVES
jgi:hypothetical protein